jgi:uncharacterized protein (TIGR02145 family)
MKKFINFLLLALVALTVSCTNEMPWGNNTPGNNNDATIILRLNTPGGFNSSKSTRNLTFAQENELKDVYVLVFDNSSPSVLVDIKEANALSGTTTNPVPGGISGTGTFTITLPGSKGVGTPTASSQLVVLANAEAILQTIDAVDNTSPFIGDNYATVMSAINASISGKMFPTGTTDRIPMWGETSQIVIMPGNTNQTLQLMRAIARIDVGVGSVTRSTSATTDDWAWDGLDKDANPIPFELQEVYIISPSDHYAVVPDKNELALGNATLPTGTGKFTLVQSETLFGFSGSDITGVSGGQGGWTSRSIYIPEADVKVNLLGVSGDTDHTNRMAVVVGGDFNNSGITTYYRLDFAPDGKNIINVLRNNLYQFNISKVSGAGYPSVEEAYNSMAMNMEVEILDWDENELDDIIFDESRYFSISRREVVFTPFGSYTETVTIKTNVTDFSMWINGTNEIQANGTLTYTSGSNGYVYTLAQVGTTDTYTLSIFQPGNNVSNTPNDRKEVWTFAAGRLRFNNFEVSQQWTNLYISIIDGASTRLFPEGTEGFTIPVNVMSLVPVALTIQNTADGSPATWVTAAGTSGLTTIDPGTGLYQASITLTVPPFQFGALFDGTVNRTATVTLTPSGQAPVQYIIVQEAPYINIHPTMTSVPRTPAATHTTIIDVQTNVQLADLTLAKSNVIVADTENRVNFMPTAQGGFYNIDAGLSRNQRFDVTTNRTGVLPTTGFGGDFTVTPLLSKYGDLAIATARVIVPDLSVTFGTYWWESFSLGGIIWTPTTRYTDDREHLIFPWNTEIVDFDVVTNVGATINIANSTLGNGSYTVGAPIPGAGLIEQYPYTFAFNNVNYSVSGNFSLEINSTAPAGEVSTWAFRQGVQSWYNTQLPTTAIGHSGIAQGAAAGLVNVTTNVEWAPVVPSAATWLTLQMNNAGAYSTPATTTAMVRNDRLTTPAVVTGTYDPAVHLLPATPTPLRVAIESVSALNPAWAPNRQAAIDFTNLDFDAGKGGASTGSIVVTQWAPVLTNSSNNLPTGSNQIPMAATTYSVTANTNLQGWGVKVFVGGANTGTPIVNELFGAIPVINANAAAATHSRSFIIPANTGIASRTLSVWLYSSEFPGTTNEILVGTYTQRALVWAASNTGGFYQWGSPNTNWPLTGTVTGWNSNASRPDGNWTTVGPCPTGWRLPTQAEFQQLINSGSTWRSTAPQGRCFGPGHNAACTTSGTVFLPAAGYRNLSSGTLNGAGTLGYYWSSTPSGTTDAMYLYFSSGNAFVYNLNRAYGFSVRCVAE